MARPTDLPTPCLQVLDDHLHPELFQALCDPVRISLVAHLAASGRPLNVTEASECCGIHFSGVSRHLALLRRAGVVRAEKQGREVYYELEIGVLAAALRGFADALEACREEASQSTATAATR